MPKRDEETERLREGLNNFSREFDARNANAIRRTRNISARITNLEGRIDARLGEIDEEISDLRTKLNEILEDFRSLS